MKKFLHGAVQIVGKYAKLTQKDAKRNDREQISTARVVQIRKFRLIAK